MQNSSIEWCSHTFNPWIGCTKVSDGCKHCYAESRDARFGGGIAPHWGHLAPRQRTTAGNWMGPLKWNKAAKESLFAWDLHKALCDKSGIADYEAEWRRRNQMANGIIDDIPTRPRVFCASLADWLDSEVPIEWLADLLKLIHDTPNLDWQLLTKRPQNFLDRLTQVIGNDLRTQKGGIEFNNWATRWTNGRAPENVWIGTSVENQKYADIRIPQLLAIPAKTRFLSCEPLLGSVDLTDILLHEKRDDNDPHVAINALTGLVSGMDEYHEKIHWLIAGGESGPGARPMQIEWAESLAAQCQEAEVAFFMKQLGGTRDKRGDTAQFPEHLRVREFPKANKP